MESKSTRHARIDTSKRSPLLLDRAPGLGEDKTKQIPVKETKTHPRGSTGNEDGSIYFIGTASTVIEWQGARILTDPNFLHAGDHVHLGPGVTAERKTNPAVDLEDMPDLDYILLSHYHEDHFDKHVEESLNRDIPIITTPHAKKCLTSDAAAGGPFQAIESLDAFESITLEVDSPQARAARPDGKKPIIKVTGTPGKHIPPGPLTIANDLLQAVPPTNGWLLELGYGGETEGSGPSDFDTGYRIYISGDTLFIEDLLKEIPERLRGERIDLMLAHLGGTTIPGPKAPLVMVTMDARQGVKLMQLMDPDVTVPIHYDDYSVFLSSLGEFKKEVGEAGLQDSVVYLDRGDQYRFLVRGDKSG
ncbi:hypothetical protein VPNG_05019 [Cytospora leucostoma]|uniref:Metallo-beta-lactamase domain-containing protein n=1 Tax=Cytospora leucostoma TaxID=1230097 RepID=A0A423X843_9PEZI|nr:hypothetical protein VPNG_05019 [Cytospora leucostoma]